MPDFINQFVAISISEGILHNLIISVFIIISVSMDQIIYQDWMIKILKVLGDFDLCEWKDCLSSIKANQKVK